MFDKICVRPRTASLLNISFLVESMLFYGNTIVVCGRDEIETLLKYFGEDFLYELISSGRINLQVKENYFGSAINKDGRYGIGLFEKNDSDYSNVLYHAHRKLINNSFKNNKFADRFSKITVPFKYDSAIPGQIKSTFQDMDYIRNSFIAYILKKEPSFRFDDNFEISIANVPPSADFPFEAFRCVSNIDVSEFNKYNSLTENSESFNYASFLLAFAESKGDIFLSSHFDAELSTTEISSELIKIDFQHIVRKRLDSQTNIDLFDECVLNDCFLIGEAYVNQTISNDQLLLLLEKSDKFRGWLKKVPDDKNLVQEYYTEVTRETFADKLTGKSSRFMFFNGVGMALNLAGLGGIGTAISIGLSAFDYFYLDKLLKGWRPNQFIDQDFKPLLKKNP